MMRCQRVVAFRILLAILASVIPFAATAVAQTTTTTGVSVEVVDTGSFSVEIGSTGITFIGEDGSAPGVTAFSGTTAYASLPIALSDTRSDATRGRYEVRLVMGPLTIGDGSADTMVIRAENIRVVGVDGLPEGISQGFGDSSTLETPVTLFSTGDVAPAVETRLMVSLQMEIPAGTMPGSFSGSISLEVIPFL